MLSSRGVFLGRLARQSLALTRRPISTTSVARSGHVWSYRVPAPQASLGARIGAQVIGGAMWWWILWHMWHEGDMITGEFDYPDVSEWTDAELGIPPDSEGLAETLY